MSPKGLVHLKGAQIYLFYELEGSRQVSRGDVIYIYINKYKSIYIYIYVYVNVAPTQAWWMQVLTDPCILSVYLYKYIYIYTYVSPIRERERIQWFQIDVRCFPCSIYTYMKFNDGSAQTVLGCAWWEPSLI